MNESVVPETGLNAVRITTIHASKGRQFPVVILAGSSGDPRSGSSSVLWDDDGQLHVRFRSGIETGAFAALASLESQFIEAERRRLLYVACTRAKSHLVVSLYYGKSKSFGALLSAAHDETLSTPFRISKTAPSPAPHRPVRVGPLPEWPEWLTQRDAWERTSQVAASTSVTSLTKGAQDAAAQPWGRLFFADPVGIEPGLPAFAGGGEEHGSRLGTAVHKVVELSRLVVDESLTTLAVEVAQAHDLTNPALLESMARSALSAEPVARAADREHWLELPFAAATDGEVPNGTVIEGVADLVYREDDCSLVIVDFKTDVGLSAKSMDAYWRQLSIYANLIHGATGQPVSELALVFCRAEPAQVFRQLAVS